MNCCKFMYCIKYYEDTSIVFGLMSQSDVVKVVGWKEKKRFLPLPLPRNIEAFDGPSLFN